MYMPLDVGSSASPQYATSSWALALEDTGYIGQVVVSEEWYPEFEAALEAGHDFRLVILTPPGSEPPHPLANPQVVCFSLPPSAPTPSREPPALQVREAPAPYGTISNISEALRGSPRIHRFLSICGEYLEAYRYVSAASLPEHHRELAFDRATLLAQLEPGYHIDHPEVWPSVAASFQWFRARYRTLYREHHRWFRQEVTQSRDLLLEAQATVEAARQLDTIPPLSSPRAASAVESWEDTLASLVPCPQSEDMEDFALASPHCPSCHLSFTEPSPRSRTMDTLNQSEAALQLLLRRLSSEAVHKVLARSHKPRVDQFLEVLQASDIRSLVQVLDAELLSFLRSLLAEALDASYPAKVFAPLRDKFEVLSEEEIPQAVQEFEHLLRHAVEEAKQQHPNRAVQLRLD